VICDLQRVRRHLQQKNTGTACTRSVLPISGTRQKRGSIRHIKDLGLKTCFLAHEAANGSIGAQNFMRPEMEPTVVARPKRRGCRYRSTS